MADRILWRFALITCYISRSIIALSMDLDERGVSSIQVQKAQSLPVSLANGKLGGIPASDLQQEAHGNPSLPRSSRKSSHLHNAPQVSPYHLGKMTLSKGTTSNAVLKITDLKGHASRKPALVQSAARCVSNVNIRKTRRGFGSWCPIRSCIS